MGNLVLTFYILEMNFQLQNHLKMYVIHPKILEHERMKKQIEVKNN